MKRLSLNSDGAFLTIIHSLIPHSKIINSTEKEENNPEIYIQPKKNSQNIFLNCGTII